MRVYLVQHGEAKTKQADPERPLSARGKQSCRSSGSFLQSRGVRVSAVWHSKKLRAKQTAEILAATTGGSALEEKEGLGPKDALTTVRQALAETTQDVMIVGHLPHLNRLASQLIAEDEAADCVQFQNAGVVCLEQDADRKWRMAWMVPPELLK
jgi:phosphohistidine phosphatase